MFLLFIIAVLYILDDSYTHKPIQTCGGRRKK